MWQRKTPNGANENFIFVAQNDLMHANGKEITMETILFSNGKILDGFFVFEF